MKTHILTTILAIAFASCSKEYLIDDTGGKSTSTNSKSTPTDSTSTGQGDDNDGSCITVAAALEREYGEEVCVGGYIVASCSKNIKNADYTYPFEGSTAIILADDTVGTDSIKPSAIMPVCLTEWPRLRSALNLVDNPELHNKRVTLNGTISKYLYRKGLKKLTNAMVDDE